MIQASPAAGQVTSCRLRKIANIRLIQESTVAADGKEHFGAGSLFLIMSMFIRRVGSIQSSLSLHTSRRRDDVQIKLIPYALRSPLTTSVTLTGLTMHLRLDASVFTTDAAKSLRPTCSDI